MPVGAPRGPRVCDHGEYPLTTHDTSTSGIQQPPTARLFAAWSSPRTAATAHHFLLAGFLLLPLNATATLDVGFTLQASYLLAACAVLIALPHALAGWTVLPRMALAAAAALLGIYVLLVVVGQDITLASQDGRSSLRDLVYLGDLTLGLLLLGLLVALVRDERRMRTFCALLTLAATAAAAYALYQWPAQRFGWPLADVNTAVNSDGFSRGHRHQGSGLLGWERIRGTFKEPLFLATFLASLLPIAAATVAGLGGRRRWAGAGALTLIVAALALTASSLAWGLLLLSLLAVAALVAIARCHVVLAALAGAALVGALALSPIFFSNPSIVAGLTGRSGADLQTTIANRSRAWQQALEVWAERPVLGHGPGQSSVRLSYRPAGAALGPNVTAPEVLGSAQGLWAAALVDVGILGLASWFVLLGSLLVAGMKLVLSRAGPVAAGLLAAALFTVSAGQLAGDRLDLRVWLVLGLLVATACQCRERETAADGGERGERA